MTINKGKHRASFDKLPETSSGQAGQVEHGVRNKRSEVRGQKSEDGGQRSAFLAQQVMSADSPQFQHLLCIPNRQSVTFGYSDFKYLRTFQFFQP